MKAIAALSVVFLAASATQSNADALHLVRTGTGTAAKRSGASAVSRDWNGELLSTSIQGVRTVGFQDEVTVEVDGATGRIRVPRIMLPTLNHTKTGWLPLKDVVANDQEITGSARINFMNAAKVRIDRLSGHINVDISSGVFSGECQPYDPATAQKRF